MAPDLDALLGPLTAQRQLPLHLDAPARAVYFSIAADREQAYQLVLLEAGAVTDLEQWLDGRELLRSWPDHYLPRVVPAAWQARHAALAVATR